YRRSNMEILFGNPVYAWLAAGAFLIVFEALTMPGLGIFLGGLGAVCTAILIQAGIVGSDATALQFACFFGLTTVWAIVLWRPLMKFRTGGKNAKADGYNDMVGGIAVVGERGLKRGEVGQVTWSGTVMNAELDSSSSVDTVSAGVQVVIKSVSGNLLKVSP